MLVQLLAVEKKNQEVKEIPETNQKKKQEDCKDTKKLKAN